MDGRVDQPPSQKTLSRDMIVHLRLGLPRSEARS